MNRFKECTLVNLEVVDELVGLQRIVYVRAELRAKNGAVFRVFGEISPDEHLLVKNGNSLVPFTLTERDFLINLIRSAIRSRFQFSLS